MGAGRQELAILMRMATTDQITGTHACSHITGAGGLIGSSDDPGALYIPAGSTATSCTCSLRPRRAGRAAPSWAVGLLAGILLGYWHWRRSRQGEFA